MERDEDEKYFTIPVGQVNALFSILKRKAWDQLRDIGCENTVPPERTRPPPFTKYLL